MLLAAMLLMMGWGGPVLAAGPNYSIELDDVPALRSPLTAILDHPPAQAEKRVETVPAGPAPKMAILLPLSNDSLGEAAQVVRQGIEAAWKVDGDAELRWYTTRLDDVQARYQQALSEGAEVVIGPLTRPEIAAIAPLVKMPTLALNTLPANPAPGLYALHLAAEADAEQVAQAMHHAGSVFPMLMVGSDPLSQRQAQAWTAAWVELAGRQPRTLRWPAEAERWQQQRESVDAVAVMLNTAEWAALRQTLGSVPAYLPPSLNEQAPVGSEGLAITVLDMPWLLTPDTGVSARYPRPLEPLTHATERLYALGIDAFRVARRLAGRNTPGLWLDGVSGRLQLGSGREVQRRLLLSSPTGQLWLDE